MKSSCSVGREALQNRTKKSEQNRLLELPRFYPTAKNSAKSAGSTAEIREEEKSKHYKDQSNHHFVQIATETHGAWGPQGLKLIREIGMKIREQL